MLYERPERMLSGHLMIVDLPSVRFICGGKQSPRPAISRVSVTVDPTHLLLVENDAVLTGQSEKFLKKVNGWDVTVATSLEEGVRQIAAGLSPDFVVMDNALAQPTLDDAVDTIKQQAPESDILVTSASYLSSVPSSAFRVLNKPYRLFDLSDVIGKRLEERRFKGITLADLTALVEGTYEIEGVTLTRRETQILGELVANYDQTVSRSYLSEVYAQDEYIIDDRRWDNHVSGLRKKLRKLRGWDESKMTIKAARSIGYKLTVQ